MTRPPALAVLLAVAALTQTASGQPPKSLEDFRRQSQRMFQNMFEASPEDRAQLQRVEIGVREERRVGNQMLEQARARFKRAGIQTTADSPEARYGQALLAKILPRLKNRRRYQKTSLFVVLSDATDARALPGGVVFIGRGLFDFAPNEAALAGVLAHELSHIDRGHLLEHLKAQKLMQAGGAGAGGFPQSFRLMMNQFARPFHPEQEVEADADAVRWLLELKYDARQLAVLFAKLERRDAGQPNAQAFLPDFFRSHPAHHQRLRAVERAIAGATNQRLYVGDRNLRERRTRWEQTYDDEFAN